MTFYVSLLHVKSLHCHTPGRQLCVSLTLNFSPLQKRNFCIYCFLCDSRLPAFERKEHVHNLCRNCIVVLQNGTTEEVTSEEEEEEDMGEVCVYI